MPVKTIDGGKGEEAKAKDFDPTTPKNLKDRKEMLAKSVGRDAAMELRPLANWRPDSDPEWDGYGTTVKDGRRCGPVTDEDRECVNEALDRQLSETCGPEGAEDDPDGVQTAPDAQTGKSFRPKQYASRTGQDVIDVAEDFGVDGNAYKFNMLKYLLRAGKKDGESELDDMTKVLDYCQRYLQKLRGQTRIDRIVKARQASIDACLGDSEVPAEELLGEKDGED